MKKKKARSRLMDSTKAARQIIASHSSTMSPYQPYTCDQSNRNQPDNESGPAKSQSKLKSRLTRPNRGEDPFGMPEAVELPTAVLQIDKNNLPKFSFGPTSKTTPTSIANTTSNQPFKFSSPLPITSDAKNSSLPPPFDFGRPVQATVDTSPPKFLFGKQTSVEQLEKIDESEKSRSTEKTVISFAKASNDWKCLDCWVSNKADAKKCACCGAKQPSKETAATASQATSKCTICKLANTQSNSDKCVNCEKMRASPITTKSSPFTKKVSSSKWKCSDCWVENEESADKCICCGSRQTEKRYVPAAAGPNKMPASSIEKDWRCEDCFITNKPSVEKCMACEGTKPGTKHAPKKLPSIASGNLFKDPDNKLSEIIKSQKNYWECRVCLASNANDKSMCVCCDAEKQGTDNVASKFKNFKFNAEPNPGFKFGIDPKVQETNLSKKVDEVPKTKSSEDSETNNNIVPKIPSFTFTLPAKKTDDKVDGPKDEALKPSFSFGIPKLNNTPVATDFVPIKPKSLSATELSDTEKPTEDEEKPQEVPKIPFKALEATKPSAGLFSSTSNPQNAMNAFLNNSEEKKKPASPIKKQPSAALETSKQEFSISAVKQSSGLFTSAATTATNNSLTTQPAPANTPAMGMFQKPEVTVTSSVSLSKPETTQANTTLFHNNVQSSPAPAVLSTALPAATAMFSFGNNQSTNNAPRPAPATVTATAPAITPTFAPAPSFAFGSISSTPTFGATPQTNASTFSLPTGNSLVNGPSNPLGGNGISANPLAGNTLGGTGGNGITPSGSAMLGSGGAAVFNAPAKETTSMWPTTTNQSNLFMANTPAKSAFSFGATPTPSPFGAPVNNAPTHVFGSSAQPAQDMFSMSQSNAGQPSMFPSPATSPPTHMFGSAQPANPAPPMGIFGTPNATAFGSSTPSMPSASVPAFNFGATQAVPAVFGFGQ
ncbi:Uncharacterized protein OBRU01_07524, partial [Operophtera brumata]